MELNATYYNGDLSDAIASDSIGIVSDCSPVRGDVCGVVGNPPVATEQFLGEAVLLDDVLR